MAAFAVVALVGLLLGEPALVLASQPVPATVRMPGGKKHGKKKHGKKRHCKKRHGKKQHRRNRGHRGTRRCHGR
jgi:hypothetical protein